jgi:hypothetical protein
MKPEFFGSIRQINNLDSNVDMQGLLVSFSDRQCRETLSPIQQASTVRRTVSGRLVYMSNPNMRKYAYSISGSDLYSPALSGIWPGQIIDICPFSELTEYITFGEITNVLNNPDGTSDLSFKLQRGTHLGFNGDTKKPICTTPFGSKMEWISGGSSYFDTETYAIARVQDIGEITTGFYCRYYPIFRMMITGWSISESEISAMVDWTLQAEEQLGY